MDMSKVAIESFTRSPDKPGKRPHITTETVLLLGAIRSTLVEKSLKAHASIQGIFF